MIIIVRDVIMLSVYWRCVSGVTVTNDGHLLTLSNGSLAIVDVRTSDTANYTCRAENRHGADEIVVSLVVQGTLRFLCHTYDMIWYSKSSQQWLE